MDMIDWMGQPLPNDHPDQPASCKWSSGRTILLQITIRMDRTLANDHLDGPASWKWSSTWTNPLQMIIGWTSLLKMIIQMDKLYLYLCICICIWSWLLFVLAHFLWKSIPENNAGFAWTLNVGAGEKQLSWEPGLQNCFPGCQIEDMSCGTSAKLRKLPKQTQNKTIFCLSHFFASGPKLSWFLWAYDP